MLTSKLHLILAALHFVGAIASYLIWRRREKRSAVMGHFSLFFIFFIFYNLCLSLPYLFSNANLKLMALGYNFAILFLFLLVAPLYKIIVFYLLSMKQGREKLYAALLFLAGMTVFTIQSYDLRMPQISRDGFVIWNNNLLAGAITLAFASSAAVFWVAIYLRSHPEKMDQREKLKAALFTAGTLAFSIASIYFIARNSFLVGLSFIFVFLGSILINAVILIPEKMRAQN